MHLLTRELAVERLGLEVSLDDAVTELAMLWVRGMRLERAGDRRVRTR